MIFHCILLFIGILFLSLAVLDRCKYKINSPSLFGLGLGLAATNILIVVMHLTGVISDRW